jgi:hypothetical protein
MEKCTEKQILEKILLPLDVDWKVSEVTTEEIREEIFVKLHYRLDHAKKTGFVIRYMTGEKKR